MKARRGVHVPWLLLLTGRVKSEISVLLALRVRADRWRRASEGLSRSILPLKRLRSMCLREVGLPLGPSGFCPLSAHQSPTGPLDVRLCL